MNDRTPFPYFEDDDADGELGDTARRLRGALSAEADLIEPGHDGLRQIKERIAAGDSHGGGLGRGLFVPLLAAAAAVLATAGATLGILVVQRQPAEPAAHQTALPPTPNPSATASPTITQTPSSTPSATSTSTSASTRTRTRTTTTTITSDGAGPDGAQGPLPVYWIGQADDGPHLYREYDPDPAAATTPSERVEAALRRMLAGGPQDPDYSSPWRPASVNATVGNSQITVDLGPEAFDGPAPDAATAEAAIQQLVYTATAAAGAADPPRTVKVLVDGRAGVDAWGLASLAGTLERSAKVLPGVWVLAPEQNATPAVGLVTVSGRGRGFEGLLRWQITDTDGTTIAEDTTQAGSTELGDFSFSVELAIGRYTVAVWSPSPKDGTDTRPFVDTKTFTVR